jgi:hypothetical protein
VASTAALSDGNADGWRADITFAEQDGKPPKIAIYCPACASSSRVTDGSRAASRAGANSRL